MVRSSNHGLLDEDRYSVNTDDDDFMGVRVTREARCARAVLLKMTVLGVLAVFFFLSSIKPLAPIITPLAVIRPRNGSTAVGIVLASFVPCEYCVKDDSGAVESEHCECDLWTQMVQMGYLFVLTSMVLYRSILHAMLALAVVGVGAGSVCWSLGTNRDYPEPGYVGPSGLITGLVFFLVASSAVLDEPRTAFSYTSAAFALVLWVLGFFVQRVVPLIERQLLRPREDWPLELGGAVCAVVLVVCLWQFDAWRARRRKRRPSEMGDQFGAW